MYINKILTLSTFVLFTGNILFVEAYLVEPLTVPGVSIEALRYDTHDKVLYFTDTVKKTIHRYNPQTSSDQVLQVDQIPSFIFPIQNHEYSFLVGLDRDVVVLSWDYSAYPDNSISYTYFTCLLVTVDGLCHGNRWNKAEIDGHGNAWLGTLTILNPPDFCHCPPNLYRVQTTHSGLLTPDIAIRDFYANGIEFTVDYRVMYTIDYYSRLVYAFNFDLSSGLICCPGVIFSFAANNLTGYPNCIVKDTEGNLFIGSYHGSEVIKINPNTGELLLTIKLPVSRVTTLTFGGLKQDVLYVGTMQSNGSTVEPLGGTVFGVTDTGSYGVPSERAVVSTLCKPFYF